MAKPFCDSLSEGTVVASCSPVVRPWRSSRPCATTLTAIGALLMRSLLFCAVTTISAGMESVVPAAAVGAASCARAGVANATMPAVASKGCDGSWFSLPVQSVLRRFTAGDSALRLRHCTSLRNRLRMKIRSIASPA
jgi:hypothetical protein